jgi:serine/threonine-protein kinase
MGVVYRAEHLRLGRPAAVKVVLPELADDPDFRARFEREPGSRRPSSIPHVVAVYDAGEAQGTLYLAMQLIEGGDLAAELRARGTLEPARALRLCEQVAEALDTAHARGLVHRDVKPANILLDHQGAYLSDFGLVKHGGTTTRTANVVGTIDYAAPEQIEGRELDGRADQYALACVLHQCLSGAPPFERDSDVATMQAHLHDVPPRISERRPGLPGTLDAVLARGMDKAPRRRFATCAALVAARSRGARPDRAARARATANGAGRWGQPVGDHADRPTAGARRRGSRECRPAGARAARRRRCADPGALPRGARRRGPGPRGARRGGGPRLRPGVAPGPRRPGLGSARPERGADRRRLRADPGTRAVKVILAVDWQAAGSPDVRAAGADETIEMPFSPLQLQVKLRRLLGGTLS